MFGKNKNVLTPHNFLQILDRLIIIKQRDFSDAIFFKFNKHISYLKR